MNSGWINSKTGIFTPDSGISNIDNGLIIRQTGRVVTVNGYIKFNVTNAGLINLGIVSGVSAPTGNIRVMGAWASNAWEIGVPCYVTIGVAMSIFVKIPSAGTNALYMSFTYVTE